MRRFALQASRARTRVLSVASLGESASRLERREFIVLSVASLGESASRLERLEFREASFRGALRLSVVLNSKELRRQGGFFVVQKKNFRAFRFFRCSVSQRSKNFCVFCDFCVT